LLLLPYLVTKKYLVKSGVKPPSQANHHAEAEDPSAKGSIGL
jgi:hypothetical protein